MPFPSSVFAVASFTKCLTSADTLCVGTGSGSSTLEIFGYESRQIAAALTCTGSDANLTFAYALGSRDSWIFRFVIVDLRDPWTSLAELPTCHTTCSTDDRRVQVSFRIKILQKLSDNSTCSIAYWSKRRCFWKTEDANQISVFFREDPFWRPRFIFFACQRTWWKRNNVLLCCSPAMCTRMVLRNLKKYYLFTISKIHSKPYKKTYLRRFDELSQ